ncbi:hypothetical protein [Clostridium formicaceticum]|uniref:Uncharacterized protein n=1 Tax=Clostridium formicaceticum TaxID=1497 RepID=A0AAC9RHL8_9CLOT|nr:hypothetical protein [Clostridium formicaceticum]AOY75875.1 hypothetical protein BJL90_08200 [Clostridium formicaceticum]ARE86216.1 hypothetical protein CLFO_05380 [Clostridium formicaceticum]
MHNVTEKVLFKKENRRILILNLCITVFVLMGYLLIIVFKKSPEEELFNMDFYSFFFLFQFILYTLLVQILEVEEGKQMDSLVQVGVFTLGIIPLIMVAAHGKGIERLQTFVPLSIQYLWGITLVNLKVRIASISKEKTYYINLFNFCVMGGGMMLLYLFYQYKGLVVVSVFDKRIPIIFFINPLLTMIGSLRSQMGEVNYRGYQPIIIFFIFWCLFGVALKLMEKYTVSRRD